jgi:hypothetical protein
MKGKVLLLAIIIVILGVILGGFAYAYIDKVYLFNQTRSHLQSLGFEIINTPVYVPEVSAILHMANVASFISIARQYNITIVFESGYSFHFITVSSTWYEYTPSNSIWWIWG